MREGKLTIRWSIFVSDGEFVLFVHRGSNKEVIFNSAFCNHQSAFPKAYKDRFFYNSTFVNLQFSGGVAQFRDAFGVTRILVLNFVRDGTG